jgi:hypothetical protein
MSIQDLVTAADEPRTADTITIDFLFLDLTTCERCVGTDRNLDSALELARGVLAATGATVEVRRTLVETAEQARELRFVSSPTIRIDGRDIALELKETSCGSEACACADGDPIACRVWSYGGREHTEAPVGLIVDAILTELYGGVARPKLATTDAYELPEHLHAFFARPDREPVAPSSCCSQAEQESCCEASAKASCCAPSAGGGCGCR